MGNKLASVLRMLLCFVCFSASGCASTKASHSAEITTHPQELLTVVSPEYRDAGIVLDLLLRSSEAAHTVRYKVGEVVHRNIWPSVDGPLNEAVLMPCAQNTGAPRILLKFAAWWGGYHDIAEGHTIVVFLDENFTRVIGVTQDIAGDARKDSGKEP